MISGLIRVFILAPAVLLLILTLLAAILLGLVIAFLTFFTLALDEILTELELS